ncbi:MAG TPA: Mur ligase family protein [Burkholderiaceae bacterium]
MQLIEQRFLRGPNLSARKPCMLAIVDLQDLHDVSSRAIPRFTDRLVALLPSLHKHRCSVGVEGGFLQRLRDGTYMAHIVEHVTLELQCLAGDEAGYGRAREVRGMPGRYRIVCAYQSEAVVTQAFALAMRLVDALAHGRDFDLAPELASLRAYAASHAPGPVARAFLTAARRRGIPVRRLHETGDVYQLGWGSAQQRLEIAEFGPAGGAVLKDAVSGALLRRFATCEHASACADVLIDSLFADGTGRIPAIAVTGTNGKTTTSLLIAHTTRRNGLTTGVTTTEGVYVDGMLTRKGDCTGYHSAMSIFGSRAIDFAVLETARGGILKRGLAYDRSDVAVVLNVSSDHLGMDGIDTVKDLARVKAVVADTAATALVLNAEDAYCVDMAGQARDGVAIFYFSLDPDNPVLLRHLEQGGSGAYLQDHALILADGARHAALLDAREMPVTLNGKARHNIANALAAACALAASGFSKTRIADGLRTFVSDSKHNPLRANLFKVDGVTVVIDYAHNCAAYAAMAEMARGMTAQRLIGVVSVPGDRRDGDLAAIGRTCASSFDELVLYEAENRGRADGETASLLREGAQGAIEAALLHTEYDSRDAIRRGLSLCKPGDVLVFGCSSSISELADALGIDSADQLESVTAELA